MLATSSLRPRTSRSFPARRRTWLLLAGLAAGAFSASSPATGTQRGSPEVSAPPAERYDNTYAKDFLMDAPWRVEGAQTTIPLVVILKDCDVDDIRELHWIRCWDVTDGNPVPLWDHDFGDERIGDDPAEHDYWTYITQVTEGHPSLPDGTLLTPANLGYQAGQTIQLKVSIYYRDDLLNYTKTRYLRVRVGDGPFPWPADWYGGDTHYHSMYTNNTAEFGAPLPAVRLAARAVGLHWLVVTDHSCDLDETGDGSYSYATHDWEYTLQTPAGVSSFSRDVFDYGSSWGGLGADVAEFGGADLRLYRGVEINLASIDAQSAGKTIHALFYNPEYISSPRSGAFGERPVTPVLPDGLAQLAPQGFAYAAHPISNLAAEWGGIDWTVNGTAWGDEDLAAALMNDGFVGLEAFNTRETRRSSDETNPWPAFDAGQTPGNPYPNELLEGIALWDACLRANLEAGSGGSPRKIFLAGGSDAHGDFNFASYLSLDSYATDNAIGKVQTVVHGPGGFGTGDLPPIEDLLAAYRQGRSIVTDGPFLEIGIDRNGDGDWYDEIDLTLGDAGVLDTTAAQLSFRWASLPEFGAVCSIRLYAGDASATFLLHEWDPRASGEGIAGEAVVELATFGLLGLHYLRAELLTHDAASGHRAYTNPIWIDFDSLAFIPQDDPPAGALVLAPLGNPFGSELRARYALAQPGRVRAEVLDCSGRLVRLLIAGEVRSAGTHELFWDGRDAAGRAAPSGMYHLVLQADGRRVAVSALRVR
ncbi:MAG: FlgD immunoglobulin-like domain containing protein [Candidatus Eisenbacteria bacterium]